ncbi:MAG: Rieske (2Fe-2S) protein [Streptosporangiaceae bacterium]|nr:Rieske (2Fe-2S) protein [Streptosporangiaceae bacterium]
MADQDDQPHRPARWPVRWPLQPVARTRWSAQETTAGQAEPAVIEAALKRALGRPSGNWFAVAASSDVRADRPFGFRVAGRELVAWRDRAGALTVGPGACPHLGAPLADGRVVCGGLVCRWHGLRLPAEGMSGWRPLPGHDDGVLVWVRLDGPGGEPPLPGPVVPDRPLLAGSVCAVTRVVGVCEPDDVVANRLDPWHGAWFHPYSFARLRIVRAPGLDAGEGEDRFVVQVTYRVGPRLGVPVLAEFVCPEPRTVVMRILEGEGAGSLVETHATPLGPGRDGRPRTAVIEATIATSARPGFAVARLGAPLLRPLMRRAAARLWRDDLAYAERRYALRTGTV